MKRSAKTNLIYLGFDHVELNVGGGVVYGLIDELQCFGGVPQGIIMLSKQNSGPQPSAWWLRRPRS